MKRHSTCRCVRIRVCVFNVSWGEPVYGTFNWFIDTSYTTCKVICLFVVEMDDIDVPDTENVHCAKSPDAQDDRICS